MVAYTDKIVEKINQKVIDLGIEENTLIIFTGDNGTDTPIVSKVNDRMITGAKKTMTDGGTRVPLIAKWKGTIPANQVSKDLVDFSDFLPTICEVASVPIPDSLDVDGRSFLPQCKGETGEPREWIYNWFDSHHKTKIFARNQRYKLYANGDFFDVPNDYLEQKPLQVASLQPNEKKIHQMLEGVLKSYENRRLDAIPSVTKRINYLKWASLLGFIVISGFVLFLWRRKT